MKCILPSKPNNGGKTRHYTPRFVQYKTEQPAHLHIVYTPGCKREGVDLLMAGTGWVTLAGRWAEGRG